MPRFACLALLVIGCGLQASGTSCDLKESGRCCRVSFEDDQCPKVNLNLTKATVPGYGCGAAPRLPCHVCSCEPTYCCPEGWVCNGWKGKTSGHTGGAEPGEWFCSEFNEDTNDQWMAPAMIVLFLVIPLAYVAYRLSHSRGGDCYVYIKPRPKQTAKVTPASPKKVPAK